MPCYTETWFRWNCPSYHLAKRMKTENCGHCFDHGSAFKKCEINQMRFWKEARATLGPLKPKNPRQAKCRALYDINQIYQLKFAESVASASLAQKTFPHCKLGKLRFFFFFLMGVPLRRGGRAIKGKRTYLKSDGEVPTTIKIEAWSRAGGQARIQDFPGWVKKSAFGKLVRDAQEKYCGRPSEITGVFEN